MKDRYCRVDGSRLELLVFECHAKVLSVDSKRECALIHVKEDAEHPLSLEHSSVTGALGVRVVTKLADAEEGPSELIVAEGGSLVALLRLADTYL